MTPEDIKQLRTSLRCTARDLATTLGIPLADIQAWEAGERFPTKQWVERMDSLRAQGPEAVVRKTKQRKPVSPMAQLDNPEFWEIVRKLLASPQLFSEVAKLAAKYDDPAVTSDD